MGFRGTGEKEIAIARAEDGGDQDERFSCVARKEKLWGLWRKTWQDLDTTWMCELRQGSCQR